jgi:hypothetical protein
MMLVASCAWSPPLQPPAPARASIVSAPRPSPLAVDGVWHGVLAGKLHLTLTLERTGDGYRGTLDSVDQKAIFPIDHAEVDGATVRFDIAAVQGSFTGTLDPAGTVIRGTWRQEGVDQALTFMKGAPTGAPATAAAPKPIDVPIDVSVPEPPAPLRADDDTALVYELHLTNFSRRDVSLQRIDVTAGASTLLHLAGTDLADACAHPGAPAAGLERIKIGPGMRALVFLWVPIHSGPVPTGLEHRLALRLGDDPEEMTVSSIRVPVRGGGKPLVIAAPLRGRWWKASNGPSNRSRHRRALIPIGGHARISQRFAIDWVRIGDDGRTFTGDPTKNESYLAYGAEALAVADGVVTAIQDGIAQNVPNEDPVAPVTLDNVAGNHIIVDLGAGRFAVWAHLQPGSLRVKVGDRVHRGQAIGLVGNSGNSTEPHLHFHVADASSPLGSEGVPYAFLSFEMRSSGKPVVTRINQLPTEGEVVSFP